MEFAELPAVFARLGLADVTGTCTEWNWVFEHDSASFHDVELLCGASWTIKYCQSEDML